MKNKLLLIFALISFSGMSQSTIWTKGNAVWHYKYHNISSGYIKVWEDGQTTIQNHVCTILKAEKHEFFITGPSGSMAENVVDYIGATVYTSNDTVYYWDTDHFSVLYDFSAQANDQWLMQTGGNPAFGCNDTSVCIVQSVGSVTIGGQNYPELTLAPASDAAFHVSGKVNARFGASQAYLLPFGRACDSTIVEWDNITFICFQDDSLYYNPTGESCEYSLGLNESVKNAVSVFPNPSQGKIELLSDIPLKNIRVMSVTGAVLKEIPTNVTLKEIDLSELPQGTYYLNIENANGEKVTKPVQLTGK